MVKTTEEGIKTIMHECMHVNIYLYVCMYAYIYICMYAYIYIRMHAYIYPHSLAQSTTYLVQYLQVLQSTADTVLIDAMQGRHLILCCSHYDLTTHAMGDIVVFHIIEQ